MLNKTILFLAFCSFGSFAVTAPFLPTGNVIDTVVVPIKAINLTSTANGVYDYSGMVQYDLHVGPNDSLSIALDFVPASGNTGPTLTPYQVSGMVGTKGFMDINGINGTNAINFRVKSTGAPSGQYNARITINAIKSNVEATVDSLMALMTNDDKVGQLAGNGQTGPGGGRDSPDNTRLGIPGYRMSNGTQQPCVGVSGNATAFTGPSAMACTFDTAIIKQAGAAIGQEFWAKGKYIIEGPVVGLVRDPRCGRAFETFSEDPYLGGMMAASYIKGAQSVKVGVTVKHFVCNDIETNRGSNGTGSSSNVSERTLREAQAMTFEYAVREGKALGVMVAYNKVNNTYCTENPHLLTDILKYDWGHRGYALSDWGAMHSTAPAANAGHDVELVNNTYFGTALTSAVATKAVSQQRLDDMTRRILRTKVFSGVIGKTPGMTQYTSDLMGAAHQQVCLNVGRESIVLAKNDSNYLPLNKNTLNSIAVIGTYANQARLSGGGSGAASCGLASNSVSPLQGITAKVGAAKVTSTWQNADVVIVVVGVSGEAEGSDRTSLGISGDGNTLVPQVMAAGKKCIVVFTGGTAASKEAWANAPAIIVAWYPGESQGTALADVIFGDVNPSGKLSSSWPVSTSSLPTFNVSLMQIPYESPDTGIGYKWYDRTGIQPFMEFGLGLSYTTFTYSNLRFSANPAQAGQNVIVTVNIQNTGSVAGDEVAQLYLSEKNPKLKRPVKELRGFARVSLAKGANADVSFTLRPREFAYFDDSPSVNKFVVQADDYTIQVGTSSKVLPLSATLTLQ
jgi:beta-glucosidase